MLEVCDDNLPSLRMPSKSIGLTIILGGQCSVLAVQVDLEDTAIRDVSNKEIISDDKRAFEERIQWAPTFLIERVLGHTT